MASARLAFRQLLLLMTGAYPPFLEAALCPQTLMRQEDKDSGLVPAVRREHRGRTRQALLEKDVTFLGTSCRQDKAKSPKQAGQKQEAGSPAAGRNRSAPDLAVTHVGKLPARPRLLPPL